MPKPQGRYEMAQDRPKLHPYKGPCPLDCSLSLTPHSLRGLGSSAPIYIYCVSCLPQLCAVEGGDDISPTLSRRREPACLPCFACWIHQSAGHHVELLRVVKVPMDSHGSVLQALQFHRAVYREGAEAGRIRGHVHPGRGCRSCWTPPHWTN